jgi:glycosyltransferase involved in cell wall biosynthesis
VSVARNRGLQESNGDFLIFLDADDRLLPEAIEAGLDSFRAHPDCGFVFGEGRIMDSNGNRLPIELHLYANGGYEEFLRENPIGFPALVMYRRDALEAVGGFRSFVDTTFIGNTSDYDLNLRLAQRHSVYCHRKLTAEWRMHSNNTSRNMSMMADSALVVLNLQRELIREDKVLRRAWEQGMKNWRRYYLAELRVEQARESARVGEWGQIAKNALWLIWFEPQVLLENVGRKVKVTLSRKERNN